MAKKLKDIESKKKAVARAGRCEAYANKVGMMFLETVNSILSLHKSVPELKDGQMFSFDDESVNKQNQVTALLRRLHSNVVTAIRKDMGIEWDKANDEADSMIVRMFGEEVTKNPAFAGWMERNHGALNAFASRSEKGLKLSDRIWRDVKQLKEEMEVAMTVSIGEGESASSMSRKVRQYLNDPDLMFRRFRYKKGVDKDGNPVYGMKWKKRVKDEVTGKYRFIDYDKDSYKTGRGVYKSASKNAMRVTRTETNIAYRRADNKRWLNMDFVLGYRINIAHNHPEKDICDTLQGDYPKDFVFDGWHPQCFCYCTPILIDEEEMVKMMIAKRDGKEYTPNGKEIKDVPANFKKWVEDNADKIDEMREKGTEPYFIRNNKGMVDGILNPQQSVQSIKQKRQKTQEQIDDIKKRWEERKERQKLTKKTAKNILNVAKGYNVEDVDYNALGEAISNGDLNLMKSETKKVTKQLIETKKLEKVLSDIIPNTHKWEKKVGVQELKKIHTAVKNKLETFEGMTLDVQKKKLEFEIYDYFGANMNGVQQKYPNTWMISQAAYGKKLYEVNYKIDIKKVKESIKNAEAWSVQHKKATNLAKMIQSVKESIDSGEDIALVKTKAEIAIKEYEKKLKAQTKKQVQAGKVAFEPMNEKSIEKLLKEYDTNTVDEMDDLLRKQTMEVYATLTDEEKRILLKYTQTYSYLNERLRGIPYYGIRSIEEYNKDMPLLTSTLEKFRLEKEIVMRRGTGSYYLNELEKDLSMLEVGDEFTEKGFLSCGAHKSKGFGGDVNLIIIAPKGARGAYVEPLSHYTDYCRFDYTEEIWDGISKETIGNEFEWIGQRGTRFRVIKKDGRNVYLQIIGQLM